MRTYYNKHYRESEILDTALTAVEDVLEKLNNISSETLAYVDKNSYKNFYYRYVCHTLTKGLERMC